MGLQAMTRQLAAFYMIHLRACVCWKWDYDQSACSFSDVDVTTYVLQLDYSLSTIPACLWREEVACWQP